MTRASRNCSLSMRALSFGLRPSRMRRRSGWPSYYAPGAIAPRSTMSIPRLGARREPIEHKHFGAGEGLGHDLVQFDHQGDGAGSAVLPLRRFCLPLLIAGVRIDAAYLYTD